MQDIQTSIKGLMLTRPNPDRDAPFAYKWFEGPYGKETLLLMGNPEHKIETPSLDDEAKRMHEFLELEKEQKQLTWMIRYDDKTIGAVWLELHNTDHVKAPAFHIMIGDNEYRGKGFGKAIIQEMISYAKENLKSKELYSRYLTSNMAIAHVATTFGFADDGAPYKDTDGLEFQNIKLEIEV